MITAELPKDVSEKITKNYVGQLEEENARLLRRLVVAKEELAEATMTIGVLKAAIEIRGDIEEELRAKVAVMAEHIETALRHLGENNPETVNWLRVAVDELNEALSAAPKVRWVGKGRADISEFKPDVGDDWEPYTFVECGGATMEIQGQVVEEDGQQVTVIVLADEKPQEGDNTDSPTSG